MKLKELLADITVLKATADMETEIVHVAYDSRKVQPGGMFVAITGFATDGNRFIPMAMEKGAAVIVTAREPETEIPYVLVESDRLALAYIGRNFFGNPAASMQMIGVTGTNGKTSSTLLLKHVLETVKGAKVGLMGTMENIIGDEHIPADRTTPESFELQALLARMRDAGCTHVIMEVSSHAIALDRVAGITYDVAAFTNLTEDHLDFHITMENYADTKAILFQHCRKAVGNRDDSWFRRICGGAECPVLTFSARGQADLYATDMELLSDGVRFTAVSGETNAEVKLAIPGKFTVYNALNVLGMAMQLGISLPAAAEALRSAQGVKGRVEVVPTPGKPYTILIDYAHSPDGLENVLSSCKGFCKGRLIAVFGCGGDRDPIKRPIMGKIGTDIADYAIITSDNPRTEDPNKIIEDIVKGIDAGKNDIIILAGKGHETYQEICGVKHHLDEREVVAACLEEMR